VSPRAASAILNAKIEQQFSARKVETILAFQTAGFRRLNNAACSYKPEGFEHRGRAKD
jgi:hypothetical protein